MQAPVSSSRLWLRLSVPMGHVQGKRTEAEENVEHKLGELVDPQNPLPPHHLLLNV